MLVKQGDVRVAGSNKGAGFEMGWRVDGLITEATESREQGVTFLSVWAGGCLLSSGNCLFGSVGINWWLAVGLCCVMT